MRIVYLTYWGTIGCRVLEWMVRNTDEEIVAVVSRPGPPGEAIKDIAFEHYLPLYQPPENVNDPKFLSVLKALDPDLFISVHHNGGALARSSVPGTQVYYQHDDRQSRRLGGIMYEELFAAASEFPTAWVGNALDGVSTRLNDEGGDFYGIHRRTPGVTSLITEFLWLSNGAEARLLARDDVRDAEAQALARGIDRWYRTEHSGSGYLRPFVDTFDSGGGGFEGCIDPDL